MRDTILSFHHGSFHHSLVVRYFAGVALAVACSCVTLPVNAQTGTGVESAQPDLDSDGVADALDLDQDNDGIENTLEGMHRLEDLSASPAEHYTAIVIDTSHLGSSYDYQLINSVTGVSATLAGSVLDSSTSVEWGMHGALPKLRNLGSGTSTVQWSVVSEQGLSNFDLTISDLDGERSENITLDAASVAGYSLSLNTNIVVRRFNNQLSFTGTGPGGDSVDDLVTLHVRNKSTLVLSYSNGLLNELVNQLGTAAGVQDNGIATGAADIAGYRHSLEKVPSTYFTSVTQSRDTDADGVPDHRDLDSDNDGLGDVVESGGIDADHNNLIDGVVNSSGVSILANTSHHVDSVAEVYSARNAVYGDDPDGDGLLSSVDGLPGSFGGARSGTDTDNDGLSDLDEIRLYHTSPNKTDSDKDGLSDYLEVQYHNTSPLQSDTDRDGLSDSDEVNIYGTIPTNADSDADGIDDGEEIRTGTDPFQVAPVAEVSDTEVFVLQPDIDTPEIAEQVVPGPGAIDPMINVDQAVTDGQALEDSVANTTATDDNLLQSDESDLTPSLRTGVSGAAGCSLVFGLAADPMLVWVLLLAVMGLVRRPLMIRDYEDNH